MRHTGRAKRARRVVCLLVCLWAAASGGVAAAETPAEEAARALAEAMDIADLPRAVPPEAEEFVRGLSPETPPENLDGALREAADAAGRRAGPPLREALRGMLAVLAVVVLCAAAAAVQEGAGGPDMALPAGALAVTAVTAGQVGQLMAVGRETIRSLDVFARALLPALAAASAATGQVGAAAARHVATMLFSDLLLTLMAHVLTPLVFVYTALLAVGAAVGQETLTRLAGFVRWAVTGLLTLSLTAFVAYLTVGGALSGAADAAALKGARFALSGAVPVVGGILSDAAETVLAGAGLVKNAVGVFGLFAVAGLCLTPFLRVGTPYLLYKLTAAAVAPLADERLVRLIDGLGGAFGLILGMTGASALLIFLSIVSAISGVGVL
ncbi:MAG: stage III sporulation protein AE [Oscillospiraceae bacterium]|jgi:stage III sporulation protein AE|nr:stage III sporulation protein AE [Oscillospiraceae bacterium]